MSENPFQPPAIAKRDQTTSTPRAKPQTRPLGITLLAGIHGLAGIILAPLLLAQTWIRWRHEAFTGTWNEFGLRPYVSLALVLFLGSVWIASSVGLWRGTAWGWKVAVAYYLYSSVHHAWTIWAVVAAARQAGIDADPTAIFPTVNLLIHLSVFAYLFKGKVAAWCELESVSRTLNIVVLFVGAVLINAVVYITQAGSPW